MSGAQQNRGHEGAAVGVRIDERDVVGIAVHEVGGGAQGLDGLADLGSLIEADQGGALVAHLLDLLDLQARLLGQLLDCGLASEPHRQLALDTSDLARTLCHMDGQADRAP